MDGPTCCCSTAAHHASTCCCIKRGREPEQRGVGGRPPPDAPAQAAERPGGGCRPARADQHHRRPAHTLPRQPDLQGPAWHMVKSCCRAYCPTTSWASTPSASQALPQRRQAVARAEHRRRANRSGIRPPYAERNKTRGDHGRGGHTPLAERSGPQATGLGKDADGLPQPQESALVQQLDKTYPQAEEQDSRDESSPLLGIVPVARCRSANLPIRYIPTRKFPRKKTVVHIGQTFSCQRFPLFIRQIRQISCARRTPAGYPRKPTAETSIIPHAEERG